MKKSNFAMDHNVETEISRFIDKYFYPYIVDSFERQYSKDEQKKGIDVIASLDNTELFIDDKCAFYYANKNLRTFTFELSYINKGQKTMGWLLNPEIETTHYNIMWLKTKNLDIDPRLIKFDDISEVESMIITKKNIMEYLKTLGYDYDKLLNLENNFRHSESTSIKLTEHIDLIKSKQLAEEPINLKISKIELEKIACAHIVTTEKKVLDMKKDSVLNYKENNTFGTEIPGSKAEEIVWKSIQSYAEKEECFTFRHFPIHRKGFQGRHEVDILIVNRNSGISVVEVKGLKIDQIESIQGGEWYVNNYFNRSTINPYKQGETQLDLLCDRIEKNPALFRRFTKRVVVALPYITRKEWKDKGFDRLINSPPILFSDDLKDSNRIKQLENYFLYQVTQPLDNRQWDLMKQFFSMDTDLENTESNSGDVYSKLYILYSEKQFKYYKHKIEKQLQNGIRIYLLCYFKISMDWKKSYKAYSDEFELQCFETETSQEKNIVGKKSLVIEDGKAEVPKYVIKDFPFFNYNQYKAIHIPVEENTMITAGAGTGKTHVMIDRIMFLLTKDVRLEDIIMITFTNKSTDEMKRRFKDKLVRLFRLTGLLKFSKYAESIKEMHISTIHSFSKLLLKSLAHELGYGKNINIRNFVQERKIIIKKLIDDFYQKNSNNTNINSLEHYKLVKVIEYIWDEIDKKGLSTEQVKNNLDWGHVFDKPQSNFNELFEFVFKFCIEELDQLKKEHNSFTTDDLICKINEFSSNKNSIKQLNKNKYLFLDEFQDSDNTQINLVASLANYLEYKLFIVGDVKQSIYRFRGADYRSFDLLDEKVRQVDNGKESAFYKLSLNQNYRTNASLLKELDKYFYAWADKGWLTYDQPLFSNQQDDMIDSNFKLIKCNPKELKKETIQSIKTSLNELVGSDRKIGILVRTNKEAMKVSKWCMREGIGTVSNLDGTFYTSAAVKDFKSLLDGLIFPTEPKYVLNAIHSPYFNFKIPYRLIIPHRGDKRKILKLINEKVGEEFNSYVKLLRTLPVMAVIQKIISENRLFDQLDSYYGNQLTKDELVVFKAKYKKNLYKLLNIIHQQFSIMDSSLYNLHKWLILKMRTDRYENEPVIKGEGDLVDITTVHRAKGLEYHKVIIPFTNTPFNIDREITVYIEGQENNNSNKQKIGWHIKVNENLSIYNNHYFDLKEEDEKEDYKEETRLLYVALTRVMNELVIFIPNKFIDRTWSELISEKAEVIPYDSRSYNL